MSTVMLRHDAPLEVQIIGDGNVLCTDVVEADVLGAHLTVQAYCFGGAFNGVDWHDGSGKGIYLSTRPSVLVKIADESYILKEGQLCECPKCLESEKK